ncbi:MAG TPA: hypothetical protein VFA32_25745 [Dehalococcoidia bacterium]|jgi:hypothetical protein|nr:hypothetical protein [Dehalococcoidia bacterium]
MLENWSEKVVADLHRHRQITLDYQEVVDNSQELLNNMLSLSPEVLQNPEVQAWGRRIQEIRFEARTEQLRAEKAITKGLLDEILGRGEGSED